MAWDVISKDANSVLGSSEVNQLQSNFDALAAQDSGAPSINVNSFIASGVASLGTVYVASGMVVEGVTSFDTIEVNCFTVVGDPFLKVTITAQDTDYTIPIADTNGYDSITNDGASDDVTYTLPGSGGKQVTITNVVSGSGIVIETVTSD